MRAVVLVGGEGTRMRPLTETTPKPLLPLVDRPMLDHVLDHLASHGVHEVVLSSPHLESTFHPFIEARRGHPAVTWITESEPLGTGGAIVHALDRLGTEPFFAMNGDILTDLDLTGMRERHEAHGAEVTIALHHVEDARRFGLVDRDGDGRVRAFREKPADAIPGDVNAGTYLIDPAVLGSWTAQRDAVSIEREIFPAVIDTGHAVFGDVTDAFWLDLGTPETYLQAHADLLEGRVRGVSYDAPWVAPDAEVDLRAHLGRRVAIGPRARIEPEAQLDDTVVHAGAQVGAGADVVGSIVGANAIVGAGATLDACVVGGEARIPPGAVLRDTKVPSGAAISG